MDLPSPLIPLGGRLLVIGKVGSLCLCSQQALQRHHHLLCQAQHGGLSQGELLRHGLHNIGLRGHAQARQRTDQIEGMQSTLGHVLQRMMQALAQAVQGPLSIGLQQGPMIVA